MANKKLIEQRVAVFIDNQNLYLSMRTVSSKVDYRRLLDFTCAGRQLIRAIIYNISPIGSDCSGFVSAVRDMGYEIRTKAPKALPDGTHKANWDMQIAVDVLAIAHKVDVVVIVSGDGDFIPVCQALQGQGVKAEIVSIPVTTSFELKQMCDEYRPITEEVFFKTVRGKVNGSNESIGVDGPNFTEGESSDA